MAVRRSTTASRRARREYPPEVFAVLLDEQMDFFRIFRPGGAIGFAPRHADCDDAEAEIRNRRDAWEDLRGDLLPEFIAKNPGQRPAAWWEFDAPERRRCVSGPHPHDAHDWGDCPKSLWYGKPRTWQSLECSQAEYESQVDYLARHGLLTPAERELMPITLPDHVH